MAAGLAGLQIEVTGVGETVDEQTVELVLESKRKMGRVIEMAEVIFNRDRRAALVTLTNAADVAHVLKVSKVQLENHDLYFSEPDMKLWARSTICVHNVPASVSEEELALTFESRKKWGRELDVDELIPDSDNKAAFIVFSHERDAQLVVSKGITKLFGVDIAMEGPMFLPTARSFSDFGHTKFPEHGRTLSSEEGPFRKGQNDYRHAESELEEAIDISKAIQASLGENIERETPLQKGRFIAEIAPAENNRELEIMDFQKAIRASLKETKSKIEESGPLEDKRKIRFQEASNSNSTSVSGTVSRQNLQWSNLDDKNETEDPVGGSILSEKHTDEPESNGTRERKSSPNYLLDKQNGTSKHKPESPISPNDLDKETKAATPEYRVNVPNASSFDDNTRNKDEPEVFTYLEAKVKTNILPKSPKERNEWKSKLKQQFSQVDVRVDEDGLWVVMGPWNAILEARHALQMWHRQTVGDDDSDWELVNGATGYTDNENDNSKTFAQKLKWASNTINDGTDTMDEEAIRKENEQLEKRFLNSDVEMKSLNGSSDEEAVGEERRQADGKEDLEEPIANHSGHLSAARREETITGMTTAPSMVHTGGVRVTLDDGKSAQSPLFSCTMHKGTKVFLYMADITQLRVDAIVNAANERLQHGGGVALAISNAIGAIFQVDSDKHIRKHRKVPLGTTSVQSTHYKIPAKYIINAVGPMWTSFRNKEECKGKLVCAFLNSLKCADEECKVRSMALPPISSGLYKVPIQVVAESLFDALVEFESSLPRRTVLKEVHIVDVNVNNLHTLKAVLFCKFRQFDQK